MSNIISNPSLDISNIIATSGIAYISSTPTWNPDEDSKKAKVAINQITNEVWLWDTDKVASVNGAWVLFGMVARTSTPGTPSYTPTNLNEIVVDSTGILYAWDTVGSAWKSQNINLYNSDGTLTADRTITGNSHDLNFVAIKDITIDSNNIKLLGDESLLIDSTTIPTTRFIALSDSIRVGNSYNTGAWETTNETITNSVIIANKIGAPDSLTETSTLIGVDIAPNAESIQSSILVGNSLLGSFDTISNAIVIGDSSLLDVNSTNTLTNSIIIATGGSNLTTPDTDMTGRVIITPSLISFNTIDPFSLPDNTCYIGSGDTTQTVLAGDLRLAEGAFPVSGGYADVNILGTNSDSVVVPRSINDIFDSLVTVTGATSADANAAAATAEVTVGSLYKWNDNSSVHLMFRI